MTTEHAKRCTGPCGQILPLSSFPPHARSHDGHRHICRSCGEQYGFTSRSAKRQQPLLPLPASSVLPPPLAPFVTPLFVTAGSYRFGLSSIALVDLSRPGQVDVCLNIHEVNAKGYPEALRFTFEGTEAALLLAALDGVTGQASAEIEALRETIRGLETERDAALQLAVDLEQRQQALRTALGL